MMTKCSRILVLIYVTTSSTKAANEGGEHQENLNFEADSLSLANPSFEYPIFKDNIFIERIEGREKGNELASADDLYNLYEKENVKNKDLPRDLKRVKRQYNSQIYGDILPGYSNYPKPLMQNYLPAAMPNYFPNRQGRQLSVLEIASPLGNTYLNNPLDYSVQHNVENTYMSPTHYNDYVAKPNENVPLNFQDYPDNVAKLDDNVPLIMQDYHDYLAKPNGNIPLNFQDYHDNVAKPDENVPLNFQDYFDNVAKPDENVQLNLEHYNDYESKPNKNVPSVSQDYHDYYDTQEKGDPISNDYYDEYMAIEDYLSNYAADKQFDKDFLADEAIIDPSVENIYINSQGNVQQENAESMFGKAQIDSPLENLEEFAAYENSASNFFGEDYIGSIGDEPRKKEVDRLEEDEMEKDYGNKIENKNVESIEKNENEEPDKKEDESVKNSSNRIGGARVFSIDPEGHISDPGLGEEDIQSLIHQVTDIKEGRNIAFMEKFEGLIQKMLN